MIKNYFIIAVRNLLGKKVYSLINITGLAIGMTCAFLIALFIQEELSFDRQHKKGDQIYRVMRKTTTPSEIIFSECTSGALSDVLRTDIPEIQTVVKTMRWDLWAKHEDKIFFQVSCLADPHILDVFDFPLIQGDPQTVFKSPASVVITEEMAHKFFGNDDPMGKIITFESAKFSGDYQVSGVLKDLGNTTLKFDFLITPNSMSYLPSQWSNWNLNSNTYAETYVVLSNDQQGATLEPKLNVALKRYTDQNPDIQTYYHLQPFNEIYLYTNKDYGIKKGGYSGVRRILYGDIEYVQASGLIAFFILIIACINYTNLATARSATRLREIGVRKVVVANRTRLIMQFLGESVLLSVIASVIALIGTYILLPTFNTITGKELTLQVIQNWPLILSLLGGGLFVGIIAGSYPAFFLSGFQPVTILKGVNQIKTRGIWLRKSLVVFQFAISAFLIISTLIAYNQLHYMRTTDKGFNSEQVVVLPVFYLARDADIWGYFGMDLKKKYNRVKNRFLEHPRILKATSSRFSLGFMQGRIAFRAEGHGDQEFPFHFLGIDEDFLDFYEMKLIDGQNFSKAYAESRFEVPEGKRPEDRFLINEAAAKLLNWEKPVGKTLRLYHDTGGPVIGLVKDFHFATLHHNLEPIVLFAQSRYMKYLHLKIDTEDLPNTLKFMETAWKEFIPNRPFEFEFLDTNFDGYYRNEIRLGQVLGTFSLIAILVACLGVLGLAAFTAEQRGKEVGIRKVLGASTSNILHLLSKEFVWLVVIANLIAWPIAYMVMNNWLLGFAYHITLNFVVFLLSGLLLFLVVIITVGYQAFKAATTNPIDKLRYE